MNRYRTSSRPYRNPVQGISVSRALLYGHLWVSLPTLLWAVGPFLFREKLSEAGLEISWWFPFSFFLPLLLAWLYRSYAVTRWKIWAYTHVEDVHRLRTKARQQGIVTLPGTWLEKSELRSRSDKKKLLALREKFDASYPDLPELPEKTFIYYSRWKLGASFLLAGIIAFAAIGTMGQSEYFWVGYLIASFMLITIWQNILAFFNRKPQLILSRKGIEIAGKNFYPWGKLRTIKIEIRGKSRNEEIWLCYTHGKNEETLNLNNHAVSKEELEILIRRYRNASVSKNTAAKELD